MNNLVYASIVHISTKPAGENIFSCAHQTSIARVRLSYLFIEELPILLVKSILRRNTWPALF